MKKNILMILMIMGILLFTGCEDRSTGPVSDSGVSKVSALVKTQANGLTAEQNNIRKRYEMENLPGAIKHLYIISPYSGQVILYSTVKGKVTSGGKRLTSSQTGYYSGGNGYWALGERIGDDGTYGHSGNYIYWWDTKDIYHQHYLGNEVLHISDGPLTFNSIITEQEVYTE